MKPALHRCIGSTLQRFDGLMILGCLLLFPPSAGAQFPQTDENSTRSVSGQFIAIAPAQFSRLAEMQRVTADTNLVRLDSALLTVSAERIKNSVYRRLEIKSDAPWRGQIYLVVHPAQSLDENVTIISRMSAKGGSYRVDLPDVLSRRRFTRAMTGVILLEFANRNAQLHSAEIPEWLTDGLSEEMLAAGSPETILSVPDKMVNGLPVTRINTTRRDMDSLTGARRVLEKFPPLTFEELSWPDEAQLDGGGAYRASAQVFVDALLDLKNGPRVMRALLQSLPRFYNWQTAFQSAFRKMFPTPLDLEKWWALQLVNFAAYDPGPTWTPAVSRAKLDEILSVPVEMRDASNSLPVRAEISLQTVIRSLDPAQQDEILRARLRDLGLAELRMSPQLAALADGYRRAFAGYLGESLTAPTVPAHSGHAPAAPKRNGAAKTLKKLNALDAQRRTIEPTIKPDTSVQPSLAPLKF
jgi:hypothetical protein